MFQKLKYSYFNQLSHRIKQLFTTLKRNASIFHNNRYDPDFFDTSSTELAKKLLGQMLIREIRGSHLKAIIVETEAYKKCDDLFSQLSQLTRLGKFHNRYPQKITHGTCLISNVYNIHTLLGICSGDNGCVLIRAAEPIAGIEWMFRNRGLADNHIKRPKYYRLCSGPGNLCKSLKLTSDLNGHNICDLDSNELYLTSSAYATAKSKYIVECPRLRIALKHVQNVDEHLRFYMLRNLSVSKREWKCEEILQNLKTSEINRHLLHQI